MHVVSIRLIIQSQILEWRLRALVFTCNCAWFSHFWEITLYVHGFDWKYIDFMWILHLDRLWEEVIICFGGTINRNIRKRVLPSHRWQIDNRTPLLPLQHARYDPITQYGHGQNIDKNLVPHPLLRYLMKPPNIRNTYIVDQNWNIQLI